MLKLQRGSFQAKLGATCEWKLMVAPILFDFELCALLHGLHVESATRTTLH